MLQEPLSMDIRSVEICPHVWFPPWSMEEKVWWCGGALLVTLSVICLEFKAHLTSMAITAFCSDSPSHLVCAWWDYHLFFNRTMTKNTPPGCVRTIWPRRRVMECCIRWPGLHNHLTSTTLRWFGTSWTAEWRKSSQQVLSICGNSFKTVGKKHSSWSWLKECHECAKL